MPAIEPGERFTVEYGNGHKTNVVALSLRQKRKIMQLLLHVQDLKITTASIDDLYAKCEEMVRMCCPDITEEQLDKLDESLAMEIASATLAGAVLDPEEKKS